MLCLGLNKANPVLVENLQTDAADVFAPALSFLGQPLVSLRHGVAAAQHVGEVFQQNEQLTEDNRKLLAWRDTALRLEAENAALRAQLHVSPSPKSVPVLAQVVGDPTGGFVQSLLLAAGTSVGVDKGQPAVTAAGVDARGNGETLGALVGRIVQVGDDSSRLLMITDVNSRIPVLLADSHLHAILGGDNSEHPRLLFLPPGSSVTVGERVVTSGNDRLLPPGIAVGIVTGNDAGDIRIAPLADLSRLEFVHILKYQGVKPLPPVEAPVMPARPRRH